MTMNSSSGTYIASPYLSVIFACKTDFRMPECMCPEALHFNVVDIVMSSSNIMIQYAYICGI